MRREGDRVEDVDQADRQERHPRPAGTGHHVLVERLGQGQAFARDLDPELPRDDHREVELVSASTSSSFARRDSRSGSACIHTNTWVSSSSFIGAA
jgi:hypothetical protein